MLAVYWFTFLVAKPVPLEPLGFHNRPSTPNFVLVGHIAVVTDIGVIVREITPFLELRKAGADFFGGRVEKELTPLGVCVALVLKGVVAVGHLADTNFRCVGVSAIIDTGTLGKERLAGQFQSFLIGELALDLVGRDEIKISHILVCLVMSVKKGGKPSTCVGGVPPETLKITRWYLYQVACQTELLFLN